MMIEMMMVMVIVVARRAVRPQPFQNSKQVCRLSEIPFVMTSCIHSNAALTVYDVAKTPGQVCLIVQEVSGSRRATQHNGDAAKIERDTTRTQWVQTRVDAFSADL